MEVDAGLKDLSREIGPASDVSIGLGLKAPNYCNLAQMRGASEVTLTLQTLDTPGQAATYTLKTRDLARVRQWVLDAGFSPSWDSMHFQFERFADHEGEYYFFSR